MEVIGSSFEQYVTYAVDCLYCECVLLMEVIGSSFEQYVLHAVDRLYCECVLLMEVIVKQFRAIRFLHEVDHLYCECVFLMEASLGAASSNTFYTRLIVFTVNVSY